MNMTFLTIGFVALIVLSVLVCYLRYCQDKKEGKEVSHNFFTSERLFVFFIEIVIAFLGFGMTLTIANANERQMEKQTAVQMTEQVIAYMDSQVEREYRYLLSYDSGKMTADTLRVSSVSNTAYFDSVLTNELILQNANMTIHGDIMRYVMWADWATNKANEATEDDKIREYLWDRYAYHLKVRSLLQVSRDEMTGAITAETADDRRQDIKSRSNLEEVKIYEGTAISD